VGKLLSGVASVARTPNTPRDVEISAITEVEAVPSARAVPAIVHPKEYLTFRLGAEEYGIDILRVQKIRGYEQPTRLAGAPRFVCAVLNLRGAVVPVVDMRMKFEMEARFEPPR
jgi:purine-binding chemotaxis protein CheW